MTQSIGTLSWQDSSDPAAPFAPYSVNFGIDLTWTFQLTGAYHGNAIQPVGVIIDNTPNGAGVSFTAGPETFTVPAYQRVTIRFPRNTSFVTFQCAQPSVQIGVEFFVSTGSPDVASLFAIQTAAAVVAAQQHIAVYRLIGGIQNVSIDGGAFSTTNANIWPASNSGTAKVRGHGGGGGSGGSSGAGSIAGGGGGGAYWEGVFTGLTGNIAVGVGAGGVAGVGGGADAGAGGNTTFGTMLTVNGGGGGGSAGGGVTAAQGTGGAASAVPGYAVAGSDGQGGWVFGGAQGTYGSRGGGSYGSGLGRINIDTQALGFALPVAPTFPGQGASGGCGGGNGAHIPQNGLAGADGDLIVEWFG